jgi:REP-associated tyrosine transposase
MNINIDRKNIHLKTFDYSSKDWAFFITICCNDKQTHFSTKVIAQFISSEVENRNRIDSAKIFCYTIMPDHLHIVMKLGEHYERDLMKWISAFKSYTAKFVKENFGVTALWQKNFYEHIIRSDEALEDTIVYVLENPVRKRLVKRWDNYAFSRLYE